MARAWAEKSAEARAVFERADDLTTRLIGGPISQVCFEGPADVLNQTDLAQPALLVAGVASWRGLMARFGAGSGVEAGVVATAGLSLGEYTALHIAGVFTFEDALELVTLRGRAMQDAAAAAPSGMVALIGASEEQARQVCAEAARPGEVLVCANFNAPGQIVISGSKAACERAAAEGGPAAALGLRATVLAVAGAFHSPLMAPAADRLRAKLEATPMEPPRVSVVSNVSGRPHGADEGRTITDSIRRALAEQLTAPVRWAEGSAYLAERHGPEGAEPALFHEVCPGRTLAGLKRRINKQVKVQSHDTPDE